MITSFVALRFVGWSVTQGSAVTLLPARLLPRISDSPQSAVMDEPQLALTCVQHLEEIL